MVPIICVEIYSKIDPDTVANVAAACKGWGLDFFWYNEAVDLQIALASSPQRVHVYFLEIVCLFYLSASISIVSGFRVPWKNRYPGAKPETSTLKKAAFASLSFVVVGYLIFVGIPYPEDGGRYSIFLYPLASFSVVFVVLEIFYCYAMSLGIFFLILNTKALLAKE